MYDVVYTKTFYKDIKKLDKTIAKRIIDKIIFISKQEKNPGKLLAFMPTELKGLRKYRVGDYRILFWIEKNIITLYGVEHRSIVYKNL